LTPETYTRLGKGTDPVSGMLVAYVAIERHEEITRTTIYKLEKRGDDWYNVGQFISTGNYRQSREPNGRKLSDSVMSQELIKHAEQ